MKSAVNAPLYTRNASALAVASILLLSAGMSAAEPEPGLRFEKTKISAERFEAASVCDIDKDGRLDIVSGGFWYAGPDFKTTHTICRMEPSGEYYDDFSDYPMDVNGDGYPDVVTGGYFGLPLRWRENPGGAAAGWKEHTIAPIAAIETTRMWDIDRDGVPEICPNAQGNIVFYRLKLDKAGKGTGEFTSHTVKLGGCGHGLGFGDVNGDGRGDFVGPDAWYEAPEDPVAPSAQWKEHREFRLGSASVPILVHDVNGDGRADLIVGEAHNYGLYWMEQQADGADGTGGRKWTKHMIDPDRSQYHDMTLDDIDNDGQPELVTGKRYRAHNGKDPGAKDPIGIYYFEIDGGKFRRVTIDYGPAETASGAGIYFWIADVDGNGWKDVVAPGKQGLYLFRNRGRDVPAK